MTSDHHQHRFQDVATTSSSFRGNSPFCICFNLPFPTTVPQFIPDQCAWRGLRLNCVCLLKMKRKSVLGRVQMTQAVEFASLQKMKDSIGPHDKLDCLFSLGKNITVQNGKFLTCFKGGSMRVFHLL